MKNVKSIFDEVLDKVHSGRELLIDSISTGNLKILKSFLAPAYRGFILRQGSDFEPTMMKVEHPVTFDWRYQRDQKRMAELYEVAKTSQWNSSDLNWQQQVDPFSKSILLLPDKFHPASSLRSWNKLTAGEKARQRHALLSWLLSQFLHGEKAALNAACQLTQAVPWTDGALYGGTQVVDEARHMEVFHTYLTEKLEKLYPIDPNLYVVIDMLMTDNRWDMKFLGMQIMIEGLALGAFSTIRQLTMEPLLRDLLARVVRDEARHTHFGVLCLKLAYARGGISESERKDREDWAYEVALLLRNRFLAREIYDEHWAHYVTPAEWDRLVLSSELMTKFRTRMFRPIIPNLKNIGLLSGRIRKHYEALGVLHLERGKAAPDLSVDDILDQED
jgi:hypothetical protein